MDIKKDFKLLYIIISVFFLTISYFVFRMSNFYFYFNSVCLLIFIYYYILIYVPNFTLLGYDARFHIFLALFSIGGLFVFPGYLFLYYINLVVFCLISEIIFDPKFYKVFGERIKNVPVTITLVMFPINLVLGDLFALIFLFGEIVFLIYLYNKRKNMKVYNPFLEE